MSNTTIKILPVPLDIEFRQGDTVSLSTTIKENGSAVDVSTRTYLAQIRKVKEGPVVEEFTIDMTLAATGKIVLNITPADSKLIPSGGYVWDLEQTNGGSVRTLLAGSVEVEADVSRT